MITARHHLLLYPFFRFYTIYKIRRHFHRVVINGSFSGENLPVLFLINHISWWDGFWAEYLNMKVFHRKPFFMMEKEQLEKFSFLRMTGGYSVHKNSREIIESLEYTVDLLEDNRNMVMLFPQGKITSIYSSKINFERGLELILRKTKERLNVIFVANLIEYLSTQKPTLFIYYQEYKGILSLERIREEYNNFYSGCIASNLIAVEQ
jgi:1-acyl-sn-glycerol-3-phosphate acyltransferase